MSVCKLETYRRILFIYLIAQGGGFQTTYHMIQGV